MSKKWIYPAHIKPHIEVAVKTHSRETGKSYNEIINNALETTEELTPYIIKPVKR